MTNYRKFIIPTLGMLLFLPNMICRAEEYAAKDIKGKFVFEALNREPGETRMGVYLFKDGKITRLVKELSGSPSWSPDGKKIVCSVDPSWASGEKRILPQTPEAFYITDETGNVLDKIYSPYPKASQPHWSPDGKYIAYFAYESKDYHGNRWLCLYHIETREHKQILQLDEKNVILSIKWSPDSSKLLFNLTDDRHDRDGLYIINIDGRGFEKLNKHSSAMGWFQDGKHIAYWANLDEKNDDFINKPGLVSLFKMNIDTKEVEEIRKSPFLLYMTLSKDGKYIYYCKSAADGGQTIFVSPIDNGTIQTQITYPIKGPGGSYSQDFSPDWYQSGE